MNFNKFTVMVVSDDSLIRKSMAYILRKFKFGKVIQAESGEDTFTKSGGRKVDIIVLDLITKGLDGQAFLTTARSKKGFKNTRFMIMNAGKGKTFRRKLSNAGASCFIESLSDPDALRDLIEKILKAKKKGR
jgi:DNA-binding response OmpR family regulator